MNIETVKIHDDGWLVNGTHFVPNDPKNRHCKAVQSWIEAGNTPDPEFTAAELLKQRQDSARAECSRRIFDVVDANAQMNLASAAAAGLLTSAQMQTYQAGLQWVADMRATWPTLADQDADISDDANWPSVPVGVIELAASF